MGFGELDLRSPRPKLQDAQSHVSGESHVIALPSVSNLGTFLYFGGLEGVGVQNLSGNFWNVGHI